MAFAPLSVHFESYRQQHLASHYLVTLLTRKPFRHSTHYADGFLFEQLVKGSA